MSNNYISRRKFLNKAAKTALAAVGLDLLGGTSAFSDMNTSDLDKYDFIFARIKFSPVRGAAPLWTIEPCAERYLLEELSSVIRCRTKPVEGVSRHRPVVGKPKQLNAYVDINYYDQIEKYPFLFMTDENPFVFNSTQKANLKRYLLRGGFVMMDDCVNHISGDLFFRSAFALLEEIFGRGSVKKIPLEHEVFHNIYDMSNIGGAPHIQGVNHGAHGIFIDGRLAVFLTATDVHCGWIDRGGGLWGRSGGPHGRHGYREAIQMGINVIMYVLSH